MAQESVVSCDTCGLVQTVPALPPGTVAECLRCGSFIGARGSTRSLEVTAALSLAALILYVPANVYPITRMYMYGGYSESTVWDGVVMLMRSDQWLVAVIVFLASMVIPLMKLAGLFALVVTTGTRWGRRLRSRTQLYKFIDVIGPWAMLDVFLLAVLVALVKLSTWAKILPGPGLLAFTAVVVLTMLASAAFDPKLIWKRR
ncbi:MAG TPA: paraquat-inducible protein A [Burkholderiales bacterium]|nr:paraquat-inducible protein A [Burkholderiales bacterium]